MSIFGELNTRIECSDLDISLDLEHTIIEPNFMKGIKSIHQSTLSVNGERHYVKNNTYVEFDIQEYLFLYSDKGNSVADQLLLMEDRLVTFFLHYDGGMIQEMYLANVDFFPLEMPYSRDIAMIKLVNRRYLQVSHRLKAIPTGKKIKTLNDKFIRTKGIIL